MNEVNYKEADFRFGKIRLYFDGKIPYGTISLDCGFCIRVRILKSDKGHYFIAYPSYKVSEKKYVEQAFCFDKEIIKELNSIVEKLIEGEKSECQ